MGPQSFDIFFTDMLIIDNDVEYYADDNTYIYYSVKENC